MSIICLFTQNNRLSQRWRSLLSNEDDDVVLCTEFDLLTRFCSDSTYIILHDENELEHLIKELDRLHECFPKKNTLVLRSQPNLEEGEMLLSHGIAGYGNVNMSDVIFIQAVEVIKSGNVWLYPDLMSYIIKKINKMNDHSEASKILDALTQREKEIAILISKGESNKMIANDLSISSNTVKLHIRSIFEKLGIKSRVALAIALNKNS